MINPIATDVPRALAAFEVPGVSVAVVKDDTLVFAAGFGTKAIDGGAAVDEHSLFAAGSISKSVTATCLAILVGEGKLGWDDRVTDFLPGFQLFDPIATRLLTVRDLLIHRSGLRDVSGGTIWYGASYDRVEVTRRLRFLRPVSGFRERYAYQNVMYLVAGELIPVITGKTWDAFARERLFGPLGMRDSNTTMPDLRVNANVAMPHARIEDVPRPVPYRDHDNVGPAASLNTSAVDLAQYLRLYLGGGAISGQTLVAPAAFAELTRAQTVVPIDPFPPELSALTPGFQAYALGWSLRDYRGRKVVVHTGGVDGMRAIAAMVPDERLGVVVLANQEEPITTALCYGILDAFLGGPQMDWIGAFQTRRATLRAQQRAARDTVNAARVPGTVTSLPVEGYAGRYRDPAAGDAQVALEGGRLVLRLEHAPCFTADLEHWHYDTFRAVWRDPYVPPGLLTFPLSSRAAVTEMRFDQPNLLDVDFGELDFRRVA
jgi:CubicO group peptidase (beta-lactamase class C family)